MLPIFHSESCSKVLMRCNLVICTSFCRKIIFILFDHAVQAEDFFNSTLDFLSPESFDNFILLTS
ncbi:MAG: hypothetical protein COY58_04510 [Gammaproteobacteria bacterium CG_4_10_14_0_8_um_filter_38_16]|nr:MAG: hypothetical protein COY58_04510 [Gammaproteobacteria bacterium CG_4_10_14_0_8_um_filter_38_16]PJA03183.1 MAG: hypothetical protein COX72_06495 [Gammaproteobacteria bacterium CG_4_10_14_0_2_um_filter_38_22]PJB11218.1 MAG: hypothetical protein CO120_00915 [Gammaproteobacteria bacterium CG_4_9_14_3_um_filter_38_9]